MNTYKVHIEFIEPILGTASPDPRIHERFIASKAPDAPSREEEVAALGVQEVVERGVTIFHKTKDGEPFLWNYQIKGFFKDACYMLRKVGGSKSKALSTYRKDIDGLIFPAPRNIVLHRPQTRVPLADVLAEGETADGVLGLLPPDCDGRPVLELLDTDYLDLEAWDGRADLSLAMFADGGRTVVLGEAAPIRVLDRPLRAQTAQGERIALASSEMLDAGTWCDFEVTLLDDSAKYREAMVEWFSYGQLRGIGQWRNAGHGSFLCRVTDPKGKVIFDNLR